VRQLVIKVLIVWLRCLICHEFSVIFKLLLNRVSTLHDLKESVFKSRRIELRSDVGCELSRQH